jgi:hypothetical protein
MGESSIASKYYLTGMRSNSLQIYSISLVLGISVEYDASEP